MRKDSLPRERVVRNLEKHRNDTCTCKTCALVTHPGGPGPFSRMYTYALLRTRFSSLVSCCTTGLLVSSSIYFLSVAIAIQTVPNFRVPGESRPRNAAEIASKKLPLRVLKDKGFKGYLANMIEVSETVLHPSFALAVWSKCILKTLVMVRQLRQSAKLYAGL